MLVTIVDTADGVTVEIFCVIDTFGISIAQRAEAVV